MLCENIADSRVIDFDSLAEVSVYFVALSTNASTIRIKTNDDGQHQHPSTRWRTGCGSAAALPSGNAALNFAVLGIPEARQTSENMQTAHRGRESKPCPPRCEATVLTTMAPCPPSLPNVPSKLLNNLYSCVSVANSRHGRCEEFCISTFHVLTSVYYTFDAYNPQKKVSSRLNSGTVIFIKHSCRFLSPQMLKMVNASSVC